MSQPVGILGLGGIGGTAARLLLKAGHPVHAVDRASAQWLPEAGGALVENARKLAEVTDIIIVALANEAAVADAYMGPSGLVAGGRDGLIVADMGTFSVALKEQTKAAFDPTGAVMLDTPISGTPEAMETGRAVIMRSGDAAACEALCVDGDISGYCEGKAGDVCCVVD